MSEDYTKGLDPELSASLERLRVAMESREQGELFAVDGSVEGDKEEATTPRELPMTPPLLPDRRAQLDFFVCDILDAVPKDDIGSMEHPMFTLSTKPDRTIRHYEHNGNSVTITPSVLGLATIFDKDVLIYSTT